MEQIAANHSSIAPSVQGLSSLSASSALVCHRPMVLELSDTGCACHEMPPHCEVEGLPAGDPSPPGTWCRDGDGGIFGSWTTVTVSL